MGKKVFIISILFIFLFAYANTSVAKRKAPPRDLKIELKSVGVKLDAERILSDRILMVQRLVNTESKSGWLKLMGMDKDKKMAPVEMPANTLLALVPRADLTITFEVTNPNKFDVVIGSIAFGLSEETVIFFPAEAKTEEVWVDVSAGETAQFEVPITILKIPELAAIAWSAIETGTAQWKARGTMVVISEEIPSGGLRQRFETGKIGTTLVRDE